MAETRVWGWYGFRGAKQTREIVAAPSMAAAARAAGYDRPRQMFNLGDTGNAEEVATASAEPGVVFWRGIDDRSGVWQRAVSR